MSWIAALAAGLLAGTLGALGLGGGSVLILFLTLFASVDQIHAQGINLVFFIPCALTAIFLHSKKKLIQWKLWFWAAPAGMLGAWAGTALAAHIDSALLGKLFAGLLLAFGLWELFHPKKKNKE